MGRRMGIPGLSFSWKRALGVSAAKGRLSRQLGIPLTQEGRQRKAGQVMGCCAPFIAMLLGAALLGGVTLFASADVLAHSGGLNAEGCHHNRKTGDYHCHRAPSSVAPATLRPKRQPAATQLRGGGSAVYYANCSEARAAGVAPLRRGDPGYRPAMDRDGDGVACE